MQTHTFIHQEFPESLLCVRCCGQEVSKMGKTAACTEPSVEQMCHRRSPRPAPVPLHLPFPTVQGLQ